ncbi:MAG TPA: M17 family peptidase N-terminal domain-containing protein, partial [Dehalococcoidales bacterium]|nr:M17 family peptidase N-terminal domain-containing protein [Dehalococcoidales bacterium]
MEIKVIVGDITKIKTDAIIVNFFEGMESLDGDIAAVDKVLDGAISQLISQGEIKGKLNEITVVHSLSKMPTARVVVTGLGKQAELSINKIRGAVAETCRWLRKKGVENIASVAQGAGVNGISFEDAAQTIAEGALLGLYAFRKHITKEDDKLGEIKQLLIVG